MRVDITGSRVGSPLDFFSKAAFRPTPPSTTQKAAILFAHSTTSPPVAAPVYPPRTAASFGHVVIIPTQNRPTLLGKCIDSIAENMRRFGYNRKIKIIVVDDSTEKKFEASNRAVLNTLAGKYPHLFEIIHYDKKTQARFISELEKRADVSLDPFMYISMDKAKHGFGGVRNLAILAALRHARPDDLVTFFDDDIVLENLHLKRQNGSVVPGRSHLFSFFHKVDSVFRNPRVQIISGRVTKDIKEPQRLIPYYLDKVSLFLKRAKSMAPNQPLAGFAEQITEAPQLGRSIPFNKALRLLAVFSHGVVARGAFKAGVRYYAPNAPMLEEISHSSSLGGANVTVRASVLERSVPYPTVDIRGEDSMWSMLMHRRLGGGLYRVNLPVLHHKGGSRGVFREYGQSISFVPVYDVIKGISRSPSPAALANQLRVNASREAVSLGYSKVRGHIESEFKKWDSLTASVLTALRDSRAWWHRDPKLRRAARKLGENISIFASPQRNEILGNVVPEGKMRDALHSYAGLVEQWPRVLTAVKRQRV